MTTVTPSSDRKGYAVTPECWLTAGFPATTRLLMGYIDAGYDRTREGYNEAARSLGLDHRTVREGARLLAQHRWIDLDESPRRKAVMKVRFNPARHLTPDDVTFPPPFEPKPSAAFNAPELLHSMPQALTTGCGGSQRSEAGVQPPTGHAPGRPVGLPRTREVAKQNSAPLRCEWCCERPALLLCSLEDGRDSVPRCEEDSRQPDVVDMREMSLARRPT